ncbi:MAG: hypothetical protein K6B12_07050, partial [Clostridiales bacterium]|nr:hypothetical protein [Clostridiales bacterium]
MKKKLDDIRKPKKVSNKKKSVRNTVLFFVFGLFMGFAAKWLDSLVFDDAVPWLRVMERLDLGNLFTALAPWLLLALIIAVFSDTPGKAAVNVFVFFAGMCAAYHLYSILFSGFDPGRYMLIWYGITLVSPVMAVLCWYAKGGSTPSIVLGTLILWVMAMNCFSVGHWYFCLLDAANTVIFLAAAAVLYKT